ncbi:reverse transcriptase domain-containing protein [Tanacetum coccineum]
MATNEETNAAGTDTRPPMLVENDYESWKIRIHRYIRGKPNGKLIWKSIQNGPTPHPMVTDPPPANSTVMPAPRKKLDSEFNDEENKLEMADYSAEIILSQDLHSSQSLQPHAKRDSQETKQSTSIVDPLAYFPPTNNQLRLLQLNRLMLRCMMVPLLLNQFRGKLQVMLVNTGARRQKVICYNCRGEGHVARQCTEPKRKMDSQYFKDKALLMEAKENGDVLDAKAEAFLADVECTAPYDQPQALTTTNMLQAQSRLLHMTQTWMKPNAAVAFMANLSSTSATTIQSIVSMIAILTDLQTQLEGHAKVNQEKCLEVETLKNELSQCKQEIYRLDTQKVKLDLERKVRLEQALVIQRNQQNAELVQENDLLKSTLSGKEKSIAFLQSEKEKILSEKKDLADTLNAMMFVPQKELSGDQVYWLSAKEIASQASKPTTPATPFVRKSRPPSQVLTSLRNVNAVFPQFEDTSSASNAIFEINKLRQQLQGKDDTIRNLDAQIQIMKIEKDVLFADSIAAKIDTPTAYKFKTDCSIIPVWVF